MRLPLYQVDAFASRVFAGNPAAVVLTERSLDDATMQSVAAENNLSETAFLRWTHDGWEIRWFTPACEIDLCGHATLAAAWVVFNHLNTELTAVEFGSKSGALRVSKLADGALELDFPARPPATCPPHPELAAGLGGTPREFFRARDYMAVYATETEIRALRPDFPRLGRIDATGIIATAPGDSCDFVSRFFAPASGIDEDPVTGSSHCTLIPWWSARLGKRKLRALQVSKRGGELTCELRGDRVGIAGKCAPFLEGSITL
ncbi:MAG: PhzF family phenazine biosynthesis protein [Planctomycetota bacterium]